MGQGVAVEVVAHRAGNSVAGIAAATGVADTVELDVHLFRGRLEVRHAKVLLWPFRRLWERWYLLRPDAARPPLGEVVAAVPDGTGLWIDLKGYTTRLPRAAHRVVGERPAVTWSSRQWWLLGWVRRHTSARTMASVGSRWQRRLALVVPLPADGLVVADRLVDGVWLARLRRRAPVLVVWGVTDPVRAAGLAAAGVDGLILDDPGSILPGRDRDILG